MAVATFEPDEDYGAIAAVTLPGPDGLFTVAVRVTDVAGNVVTVLKQVRLDTTGPVIATSGVAGGTAYDIGVTLHLTYGATDAGVGLAMIEQHSTRRRLWQVGRQSQPAA